MVTELIRASFLYIVADSEMQFEEHTYTLRGVYTIVVEAANALGTTRVERDVLVEKPLLPNSFIIEVDDLVSYPGKL